MRRLGALLAILMFTGLAFAEEHHHHQELPTPTGLTATPGTRSHP